MFLRRVQMTVYSMCYTRPQKKRKKYVRRPTFQTRVADAAHLCRLNTAVHVQALAFLSRLQTVLQPNGYLRPCFLSIFNHAPKTTNEWCWERDGRGLAPGRRRTAGSWQAITSDSFCHTATERPLQRHRKCARTKEAQAHTNDDQERRPLRRPVSLAW